MYGAPVTTATQPRSQAQRRGRKSTWYTLFAHVRNYSKGHVAELGVCNNMTIDGSRELHKSSLKNLSAFVLRTL